MLSPGAKVKGNARLPCPFAPGEPECLRTGREDAPDDDEGQGDDAVARDSGAAANGPRRLSGLAAVAEQPTVQKSMAIRLTLRAERSAPAHAGATGNRRSARKQTERPVARTSFKALTRMFHAREAGAPACCRLTRSEWFKPATCRRSGLSAFCARHGLSGLRPHQCDP